LPFGFLAEHGKNVIAFIKINLTKGNTSRNMRTAKKTQTRQTQQSKKDDDDDDDENVRKILMKIREKLCFFIHSCTHVSGEELFALTHRATERAFGRKFKTYHHKQRCSLRVFFMENIFFSHKNSTKHTVFQEQ
jgi:hypothetical protein